MREHGVGPGSKVLLHSANCMDSLTVLYATWRVGAIIVPTNYKLLPDDVVPLAKLVAPDLVIIHASSDDHARALCGLRNLVDRRRRRDRRVRQRARVTDDRKAHRPRQCHVDKPVYVNSPAWYFFTSGTSGRPKAAVLEHDQMAFVSPTTSAI